MSALLTAIVLLVPSGCTSAAVDTSPLAIAPVIARVEIIKPTPNFGGLGVGPGLRLSAIALTAAGAVIPETTFTWTSSDTTVIVVDQAGLLSGLKVGQSTVTATARDATHAVSAQVVLSVVVPI